MDRRRTTTIAIIVVFGILLPSIGATLFLEGPFEGTRERLRPGAGYKEAALGAFGENAVASAVSQDGRSVAVVFQNNSVKVWDRNGSEPSAWNPRPDPQTPRRTNCAPSSCGVRFMPNGTLVRWNGLDLWAHNASGGIAWSRYAENDSAGFAEVEVLRDGTALLVGHGGDPVEFIDLVNNTTTSYPPNVVFVAATSASGEVVALHSLFVEIRDKSGNLLAEVVRNADVQVSADGRVGVVGDGTDDLEGTIVVLDLANGTGARREIRVEHMADIRGDYPSYPHRIFLSPNGRFVAVKAEEWLDSCGGFDCVVTAGTYVRLVDLQDSSRVLGFAGAWQNEIAVLDDGSAVGVRLNTLGPKSSNVTVVVAEAGASPPQKVREGTGVLYERQVSGGSRLGLSMGLLGLSLAGLTMALSPRRKWRPGPPREEKPDDRRPRL